MLGGAVYLFALPELSVLHRPPQGRQVWIGAQDEDAVEQRVLFDTFRIDREALPDGLEAATVAEQR